MVNSYIIWPKNLPAEAVKPHLRPDFDRLSPEMQDHAWVVAEMRALNPGRDPGEVLREEATAIKIMIIALFFAIGLATWFVS